MKNRFKEIRKSENLNQEQFANELNLSRGQIACYETGRRVITDRTIKDVCLKYNINEEWLRTGKGDMKIPEPLIDEFAFLVGQFVTDTMEDEEKEFRKKVIESLLKLDDTGWSYIEKLVDDIKKD